MPFFLGGGEFSKGHQEDLVFRKLDHAVEAESLSGRGWVDENRLLTGRGEGNSDQTPTIPWVAGGL